MQDSVYLGTEKVGRLLGKFALPCIFSLIISCLYNIVDQIFVGNGVGYLGNALLGSFLGGVVIIAIGYTWGDGLLQLIGATGQNLSLAHDYGFIIYAMMPLALVQNTLASIIRAEGSPQYAMGAMLVGAVLNIIGDPVAIFVLDMGIKGAAWATILGQFVSFLICAAYLARSKTFRICGGSFKPRGKLLRQVMALGASSFLTQLSIVVITVINLWAGLGRPSPL
nr:polysaccharide biosynthesis C-terminal domain-containing protein [Acutalibacter muris]